MILKKFLSDSICKDLKITSRAIQQLKIINSPLRISVDSGGCSGFQYKMEIPKQISKDDIVFSQQDTRVVVDQISLEYIKGSTLDYSQELIGCNFIFLIYSFLCYYRKSIGRKFLWL